MRITNVSVSNYSWQTPSASIDFELENSKHQIKLTENEAIEFLNLAVEYVRAYRAQIAYNMETETLEKLIPACIEYKETEA